jgi:histidyl-tRNA synthetase
MSDYQTPRGTRDLMPEHMKRMEWMANRLKPIVELYGFQPVETPAYESFDLLSAKSGADIENEIFAFEDKGNRKMGLRFDGTVPIARIVANNPSLPKPIKYYYLSRYWRYDEPQAGRYRELYQLGVELIGSEHIEADAEVIACAAACIKNLGIKSFKINLNDRRIFDPLTKGLNHLNICRIIDKMEKQDPDEIRKMLRDEAGDRSEDIMDLCSLKGDPHKIIEAAEDVIGKLDAIDSLRELVDMLETCDLGRNINIDLSIVRGLDYYTSTVFEIKDPGYNLTLVGGGRYDNMIGVYSGIETPATGWGMGIDRMIDVVASKDIFPKFDFKAKAAVIPINTYGRALAIAERLRSKGILALMELKRRKLGKSIEWASKNAQYAVIVGETDLKKGEVTIRNLESGKEWKAKVADVATQLKLAQ